MSAPSPESVPQLQYDLLTLGETLLRLSPPGALRIEQANHLEVGVGGTELNVAALLSRLGRRTAWVSRLPEGPLGRIIDSEARRHGVDTRWVRWVADARQGLMFYEPGPQPRTSRVLYDRKASAAAALAFEDAPWERLIAASEWLHLSGITPALSASCSALVYELAALAAAAKKPVSYDLNYRSTLSPSAEARAAFEAIAPHLELLILAERDAQGVLDFAESGERLAEAIARRYKVPIIALTRPPEAEPGSLIWSRGSLFFAPRYPVELVDRIGAGDSFVAGLLHGLLDGDIKTGLALGAFAAAMALATPGDINYLGPEDLARFRAGKTGGLER